MEKKKTAPRVLQLRHAEAAKWNQTLLKEIQDALGKNPTADLMSLFHEP
jgi:hypothetical protein